MTSSTDWNAEINRLRDVLSRLASDKRLPPEVRAEVRDALARPSR